jgi:hypothetical protein
LLSVTRQRRESDRSSGEMMGRVDIVGGYGDVDV